MCYVYLYIGPTSVVRNLFSHAYDPGNSQHRVYVSALSALSAPSASKDLENLEKWGTLF